MAMIQHSFVRKSPFSGKVHEMLISAYPKDVIRFESGKGLIQDIFPYMTAEEREFVKTGITPQEWKETFG